MKPATSTASVSPSSFHLNSDGAAAGCLSTILRRLICGALNIASPTQNPPPDAVAVPGAGGTEEAPRPAAPPAPGIVARLMGLESMPAAPPCAPYRPIGRSRSTGSPEGWPEFLQPPNSTRSPQQILPSQSHSFRELPTFLRKENDEFLLLSFTADDGEGTSTSPAVVAGRGMGRRELEKPQSRNEAERPPEKVSRKSSQKAAGREKAKAEAGLKPSSRGRDPTKTATQKETRERTVAVKRRDGKDRKDRKEEERKSSSGCSKTMVEPEPDQCSSQNSSPVSVLDHLPESDGECLTDASIPISDAEEEEEQSCAASSRRKLSSELDCFHDPSRFFQLVLIEEEEEGLMTAGRGGLGRTRDAVPVPKVAQPSADLQAGARRLVEGELQRSNWVPREPHRAPDFEEIVVEFGLQVLEALLHETVGEFCHVPCAL
uniref:Uncharacterized protein TP_0369 n=1 Tax=Anthurium amnicola TaxID=1678845 RepID=A0A1D1YKN3_9ARAE